MSHGIVCHSRDCENYASGRYTWPGKDEAAICPSCTTRLQNVATALGLHVQVIPLTPAEHADLGHPLAAQSKGGA